MTFKEFFNKRDSTPFSVSLKKSNMNGMNVVSDFSKAEIPDLSVKSPSISVRPPKPAILSGRNRLGDRPIESKPTDFLARSSKFSINK